MHLPGVRFTIRQQMITIAIVGLPLGLFIVEERQRRTSEFLMSLATYHKSKTVAAIGCSRTRCTFTDQSGKVLTSAEVNASGWHEQLAQKYRYAAVRPWMPVEPDPPRP
jgi:hypothetical protein